MQEFAADGASPKGGLFAQFVEKFDALETASVGIEKWKAFTNEHGATDVDFAVKPVRHSNVFARSDSRSLPPPSFAKRMPPKGRCWSPMMLRDDGLDSPM